MEEVDNKQIVLRQLIDNGGLPKLSDFAIRSESVKLKLEEGSNGVLVKNIYLSIEPYLAYKMKRNEGSFLESFTPGQPISGFGVAKVLDSGHPNYERGDLVWGITGFEEYSIITATEFLIKIEHTDVSLSYYTGLLGMPGLTAYVGFYDVCCPKKGEAVFISSAFGAIGQIVGQFAKLLGCYVVGSVGSNEKVDVLKSKFGFDEAFNYKEEEDLAVALRRFFPNGIDIFFDNVGGKTLDAALSNMRHNGRIAICGRISDYNVDNPQGLYNFSNVLWKRIRVQGFYVFENYNLYPKFLDTILPYLREGKIEYVENITQGLESVPPAVVGLFDGQNVGKQVVAIATE